MYLMRAYTDMQLKEIGEYLEGRSYNAVHLAIRKLRREMGENISLRQGIEGIESILKESQ